MFLKFDSANYNMLEGISPAIEFYNKVIYISIMFSSYSTFLFWIVAIKLITNYCSKTALNYAVFSFISSELIKFKLNIALWGFVS